MKLLCPLNLGGAFALALLLCGVGSGTACGAAITIRGSEFDVTYDPNALSLYGMPSLVDGVLLFSPDDYDAQSLTGAQTSTVSATLQDLVITPHGGWQIGDLFVQANGAYRLHGAGSSVGVTGSLMAADAGNTAHRSSVGLVVWDPLNINDGRMHDWTGSTTLLDGQWVRAASSIDLTLNTTLTASTQSGSGSQQALIRESLAGLELHADLRPVPLPPGVWLLLSGIAGFLVLRTRGPAVHSGMQLGGSGSGRARP